MGSLRVKCPHFIDTIRCSDSQAVVSLRLVLLRLVDTDAAYDLSLLAAAVCLRPQAWMLWFRISISPRFGFGTVCVSQVACLSLRPRSALATPVGPTDLANAVDQMLPASESKLSALPHVGISGLNHTARTFAVYALQVLSPATTQDSLAACWLNFGCTGLSPAG
jgi:hypothetical protein